MGLGVVFMVYLTAACKRRLLPMEILTLGKNMTTTKRDSSFYHRNTQIDAGSHHRTVFNFLTNFFRGLRLQFIQRAETAGGNDGFHAEVVRRIIDAHEQD